MAKYYFEALDKQGRKQDGFVEAESLTEANQAVFAMQLHTLSVRFHSRSSDGFNWSQYKARRGKVAAQELILFTKQLVTTIRVGIPISQCLQTLEQQSDHPRLRYLCGQIRNDVQEGSSLSAAMGKHPDVFSKLYCSVVAAGESSGTLPEVMDRLLYLIEHEAMVRAEVKSAMRYPIMVVAALAVAFVIMVGFVIPKFVGFFARSGLELPWPTRACIWMSEALQANGLLALAGVVALGFLWKFAMKTERGQLIRDTAFLRIPLVGDVLIKAAMTRFASIFAILQSSGVMILESLTILSQTVGNAAIAGQFTRIRDSLQEGRGIAEPLREARYFPPLLISMVAIGEETGRLDEMLHKVSEHYDVELRYNMKKLTDSIGPILIITLAAVVGFFALAIYMPMWDLTKLANKGM